MISSVIELGATKAGISGCLGGLQTLGFIKNGKGPISLNIQ